MGFGNQVVPILALIIVLCLAVWGAWRDRVSTQKRLKYLKQLQESLQMWQVRAATPFHKGGTSGGMVIPCRDGLMWEAVTTERGQIILLCPLGAYWQIDGRLKVFELVQFVEGYEKPHGHRKTHSIIRVVCGSGIATIGDKTGPYKAGDTFDVPPGTLHGFVQRKPTILLTELDHPIKDSKTGEFDFFYPDD